MNNENISALNELATINIEPIDIDRNEINNMDNLNKASSKNDCSTQKLDQDANESGVIPTALVHPKNPKFKDYDSFEQAYENLQGEFTRKSQELADLKKQNVDKVPEQIEDSKTPAFLRQDWSDNVTKFFNENEFAKPFKSEISKLLVEDESIKNDKTPLTKALLKVLATKSLSPEQMIKDEQFLNNFVYANEDIKQKFIQEYLTNLKNNKVPTLISKSQASALGVPQTSKPKTLKEVKELVNKMFN